MPLTPPLGTDTPRAAILIKIKDSLDFLNTYIGAHTHSGATGIAAYTICTNATRPTTTVEGFRIYETDTYNTYTWDGTNSLWRIVTGNTYATDAICLALNGTYTCLTGTLVISEATFSIFAYNGTDWYKAVDGAIFRAGGTANNYLLALMAGSTITMFPYPICTSTTRPLGPPDGAEIFETDTGNKYIYNGTLTKWRIPRYTLNRYAGTPDANTLNTTYSVEVGVQVIDTTSMARWAWNGTNWYKTWSEKITEAGAAGDSYLIQLESGATINLGPKLAGGGTNYLKEDGSWDNPVPATLDAIADVAAITEAQGQIFFRAAAAWSALDPGAAGKFLQSGGAAADPVFAKVDLADSNDCEGTLPVTRGGSGRTDAEHIIKGWIEFNGTGTIAITDSFNVDSIVDNATGDYDVVWDTDFSNAGYAIGCCAGDDWLVVIRAKATTDVQVGTRQRADMALADATTICVIAIGDQ